MEHSQDSRLTAIDAVTDTVFLVVGLGFAVSALVVLAVRASTVGDTWATVSVSIYGSTLVLLYVTALLSHVLRRTSAAHVLDLLDRSAIYLLIAGSYTPFTLTVLRGGWGWSIFGVVWGLAVLGIIFGAVFQRWRKSVSGVFYLLMGWTIVIAIVPLLHTLSVSTIAFLVAGGVFYSTGMLFFLTKNALQKTLWHAFVLAGSICHFIAVFLIIRS